MHTPGPRIHARLSLCAVGTKIYVVDGSGSVRDAFRACHARTVGAAVKRASRLDAVPDHLDVAVLVVGCEGMYRALEAVESV